MKIKAREYENSICIFPFSLLVLVNLLEHICVSDLSVFTKERLPIFLVSPLHFLTHTQHPFVQSKKLECVMKIPSFHFNMNVPGM